MNNIVYLKVLWCCYVFSWNECWGYVDIFSLQSRMFFDRLKFLANFFGLIIFTSKRNAICFYVFMQWLGICYQENNRFRWYIVRLTDFDNSVCVCVVWKAIDSALCYWHLNWFICLMCTNETNCFHWFIELVYSFSTCDFVTIFSHFFSFSIEIEFEWWRSLTKMTMH